MNLRSIRTLILSILFAGILLPGLASAQDEPQVFVGLNVQNAPIIVGVDTTFDVAISWATIGAWTHTEVYVGNTLYGCFDTPNKAAFSAGTVTVSLPVQGALLTAGDYNLFMFQASNASCNDVGNTLAVAACAFNVGLCPNDGLAVINESTVTVAKTFSDANPAVVPVSLVCTDPDATITVDDGDAGNGDTAEFTVTDYVDGTTCTASEDSVPAGYTTDNSDCTDMALVSSEDSACEITNTQNPVTVTVNKTFSAPHPVMDSQASITLTCPTATVDGSPLTATKTTTGYVATFEVSNFPFGGEACVATETIPAGYVQVSAVGCNALTVMPTDDAGPSCSIQNGPTSATFTVRKNFSDNNTISASVTASCTNAGSGPGLTMNGVAGTTAGGSASEAAPFPVVVKYADGSANCSATEVDLVGYTQKPAAALDCGTPLAVAVGTTNVNCEIFNDQDPILIHASKVYSNGGSLPVSFAVACTNLDTNGTVLPATANASPGNPAVFTVNDIKFNGTTNCKVTEPVPPGGYYETSNTCDFNLTPTSDAPRTCAITNTPTRATFKVTKFFADGNDVDEIEVSIDCNTGLILDQDKD
ncbi:MAG: hypothetical protein SH820_16745, partial [Xanthomonadales bacterium]|nr:hypothetical protein [Xanthomonadales bacterium]